MNFRYGLFLAVCVAVIITAGCTNVSQTPVSPSPTPSVGVSPAIPATASVNPAATGCADDVCTFVPTLVSPKAVTSLRIEASPQRYSPMMSSTPGVGLVPNATGFDTASAVFVWDASFGQFVSWDAPDYTVKQLGAATTNSGKKLYWSFTERPSSTTEPVIISVNAKDRVSGAVLGTSTVTLAWDGDNAVTVQNIQ